MVSMAIDVVCDVGKLLGGWSVYRCSINESDAEWQVHSVLGLVVARRSNRNTLMECVYIETGYIGLAWALSERLQNAED